MTNTNLRSTHVSEVLPRGWAATTLGELRQDLSKSIEPKAYPEQSYELYSVPSFELKKPEITPGSDIGSAKRTVEKGVVLLCKINPRINRVWVVGDHTPNTKIASTEWITFFPLPGLEPQFLSYYMQQSKFRDYLATNVSGVGGSLMRVKPSTIETYPFLLPPLNEQHRIVEKIEELFTKLDAGVRSLEQARAQLKSYRRSVLKAAVEGELSREWREAHGDEVEPASELLERILQERREKFAGKKYKVPTAPDVASLPALPDMWVWSTTGQLCDYIVPNRDKPKSFSGNTPWITLPDFKEGHETTLGAADTAQGLSDEEICLYKAKVVPQNNVIMSCVGRFGLAAVLKQDSVINQQLHAFLVPNLLQPEYLVYAIKAQASLMQSMATSTTISYLNASKCNSIPVALPPLEEQRFIVEEVERRLSVVDKLEATVEENLKQAGGLRQSILKQAFSGELVPQDPDDEPASALLERIREERQAMKQKAREGRRVKTGRTKRVHAEQEGLF